MSHLHLCANCGDPAPNSWLCSTCESIKERTKTLCHDRGQYWGHQVTGAVYSALTEYRESKLKNKGVTASEAEMSATVA